MEQVSKFSCISFSGLFSLSDGGILVSEAGTAFRADPFERSLNAMRCYINSTEGGIDCKSLQLKPKQYCTAARYWKLTASSLLAD